VHDGFLWLGKPIPIMERLIHRITWLPYKGANLAKEFGKKTAEKDLVERMKRDYDLLKKSRVYSILSITDQAVQIDAHILAGKVMQKCRTDEVPMPVISLVAQCAKA